MHVLSARGVESEAELPFAALHQLLRPALGELDGLPAPQAAALRRALGLADGAAPERFLVFAGCLSLLSELAERRPVLCLVDDAHWLDEASADALRFVARRLGAEGIAMLFGAREGDVRRFEASDVPSLALAGLDAEAAGDAARARRGRRGRAARPRPPGRAHRRATRSRCSSCRRCSAAAQLAGAEPLPEQLPLTARGRARLPRARAPPARGRPAAPARRRGRRHRAGGRRRRRRRQARRRGRRARRRRGSRARVGRRDAPGVPPPAGALGRSRGGAVVGAPRARTARWPRRSRGTRVRRPPGLAPGRVGARRRRGGGAAPWRPRPSGPRTAPGTRPPPGPWSGRPS